MPDPIRLLVVEPDSAAAARWEQALTGSGLTVIVHRVDDWRSAAGLGSFQPDLVLTGVGGPGLTPGAFGAVDRGLGDSPPPAPVIAIAEPGAAAQGLPAGAVDYVFRDQVTARLPLAARAALERVRIQNELRGAADRLAHALAGTIECWVTALDLRAKEAEGHAARVTDLTLRVARRMGFPANGLAHVKRGALLHDVGKMAVPDSILLKPGRLTAEERAVMERHTTHAYDLLEPIPFLRPAIEIPYCHHERLDGSGYPRGLEGDQIPLAARIFAVVDVWDALGTARLYRAAWPRPKVVDYLRSLAGKQLDARVVEALLDEVGTRREG